MNKEPLQHTRSFPSAFPGCGWRWRRSRSRDLESVGPYASIAVPFFGRWLLKPDTGQMELEKNNQSYEKRREVGVHTHSYGHPSSLSQAIIYSAAMFNKRRYIDIEQSSRRHSSAFCRNSTRSHLRLLLRHRLLRLHLRPCRCLRPPWEDALVGTGEISGACGQEAPRLLLVKQIGASLEKQQEISLSKCSA